MNWLDRRMGARYEDAVTLLALLFFCVVGGLTFWVLSQVNLTLIVRAEISFGLAMYGASRVELWGSHSHVSTNEQRGMLILPTFCWVLAAGSQTVIITYGLSNDRAFELAVGAMIATCFLLTLVGAGIDMIIKLIRVGVRLVRS